MRPDGWILAALAWVALVAVWLFVMPPKTRGKAWHYVMMTAPLAAFAAAFAAPPSLLRETLFIWLASGGGVLAVVALGWLAGTMKRNHGLMDVAYPLAPAAAAGTGFALSGLPLDLFSGLFLLSLGVWAIRLAVQTWGHNIHAERQPYAHWRKSFGPDWLWWSGFQVHLLQGVTVWLWCAPFAFILTAPTPRPTALLALGVVVWLAGFLLQSTADRQLAAFKRAPANRGGLLDTGAWAIVRHPNYLGESVMWAGWFVLALAHPWGWATVFAPLYTGWFMGYASAAPFKEQHMARTRPEAWAAYCARTPRFLPWPRPKATPKPEGADA